MFTSEERWRGLMNRRNTQTWSGGPKPGQNLVGGGAQVQCPWICAFLCFRFTLGREEVLADRGLEFGSPKEEKSPKASSVPVRPVGGKAPVKYRGGMSETQELRDPGTGRILDTLSWKSWPRGLGVHLLLYILSRCVVIRSQVILLSQTLTKASGV